MEQTNGKRKRTTINPQLKENVVRDYHELKSSLTDLSIRYKCAYHTVEKIVENNPYRFWENQKFNISKSNVKIPVTETRKDLSYEERIKLLAKDARTIVELTLDAIKVMLESNPKSFKISELINIFQAVAPYVLDKRDSRKKDTGKESSSSEVFRMFKQQVSEHGKEN